MQEERLPILIRQPCKGAGHVNPLNVIVISATGVEDLGDSSGAEPSGPPNVSTLIDHDGEKPGPYRHARSKLAELSPRASDRLLCGVFGFPAIPEHRVCKSECRLDKRPDKRLEGGFITDKS